MELQRQLEEEESRRQEEMKTIFEFLQVEPQVFRDFIGDMEYEFKQINNTLMNHSLSGHEALVKIYQSVHAIKSNAYTLGQNTFGNKIHNLESYIKKLREQEEIAFNNMLNLTLDIEKLIHEKDKFKKTIKRINSHKSKKKLGDLNQAQDLLVNSLIKTVNKVSVDLNKKVKFVIERIDAEAVEKGPRRLIKELLIQLIRNSVVHGIESPEERLAAGKKKTGVIHLSIKMKDDKIQIILGDDGRGFDYDKVAKKALHLNLIKPEDIKNKKKLLKIVFSPGFSTSETEGTHAGRGIGLNLVQDRIRDRQGSIKLKSDPGKGSVFLISFSSLDHKSGIV